jgi:retron-type reverse transcriptase
MASARRWVRPGDWFLKGDVAKFYDSVDHDRLREALARRFRERRFLQGVWLEGS